MGEKIENGADAAGKIRRELKIFQNAIERKKDRPPSTHAGKDDLNTPNKTSDPSSRLPELSSGQNRISAGSATGRGEEGDQPSGMSTTEKEAYLLTRVRKDPPEGGIFGKSPGKGNKADRLRLKGIIGGGRTASLRGELHHHGKATVERSDGGAGRTRNN